MYRAPRICSYLRLSVLAMAALAGPVPASGGLLPDHVRVDAIHADVAFPYVDGQWQPHVNTVNNPINYAPHAAVIVANETTIAVRPPNIEGVANFDFIGVAEGASIWHLQQNLIPGQVFLGGEVDWDLPRTTRMLPRTNEHWLAWDPDGPSGPTPTAHWVAIRLVDVRGPGDFSVWQWGAPEPRVWMATSDGIDAQDELHVLIRSHEHYNWAFTAAGHYEVDLVARTYNADGTLLASDITTFYFHAVPEPSACGMALLAAAATGGCAWRKRRGGRRVQEGGTR